MSENMQIDAVFTVKPIKSRNSYMIWIPKNEAEFLGLKADSFIRVGLKKVKQKK